MGQHDMAGTVDSVDKNGFVDVETSLGELKVHFPGASQHLEKSDRIILHLGYSMDRSASQSPAAPSRLEYPTGARIAPSCPAGRLGTGHR